jgi:Co/Zn/Cd efflux system component
MGIVGSGVVAQGAWSLAAIVDLHVWQIGPGQILAIVSIVSDRPKTPQHYREIFQEHEELRHITIEIQPCRAVAND